MTWKLLRQTENATIMVDFKRRTTKVIGIKRIYLYQGIYPDTHGDPYKVYNKQRY